MNINKFTQKSMEAVGNCEKIAYDYGHQELAQEHLLYSMLTVEDSLINSLLEKMGLNISDFKSEVETLLQKRPKVSGGNIYVGNDLNKVLIYAENEAKQMGDSYVSIEHLFLSLLSNASNEMKVLFKVTGVTRDKFLKALSSVRGNQRVTTDNPEATYDTLNKYAYDLVEKA